MNYKNIIQILLLFLLLTSCFIGVNVHKYFTYYKVPVKSKDSRNINLDGIYYSSMYQSSFLFLYKDGSIYIPNFDAKYIFEDNPNNYLYDIKLRITNDENNWGNYIIRNDSIIIQYFRYDNQMFRKRNSQELYGKIINENKIIIYKYKCQWCKLGNINKIGTEEICNPTYEYNYYHTNFKHDSSKAWFKKKKWYKKGVFK